MANRPSWLGGLGKLCGKSGQSLFRKIKLTNMYYTVSVVACKYGQSLFYSVVPSGTLSTTTHKVDELYHYTEAYVNEVNLLQRSEKGLNHGTLWTV